MHFIIYIVGFLVSYLILKYLRDQTFNSTWTTVILTFLVSLLSWLSVAIVLGVVGILFILNKMDSEPPKWL